MARVTTLRAIYQSAVSQISQSPQDWMDYLKFASGIYKYSFDNALLIYMQNPEATMLASLPLWNKLGRYINRGEKAIGVSNFQENRPHIDYLFDVFQTHGRVPPQSWSLQGLDLVELTHRLSSNETNDLGLCITQLVKQHISSFDLYQDIELDMVNHPFATFPISGVQEQMQELIAASSTYFIHSRCRLPEPDSTPVFDTINDWNNVPLMSRLGGILTEISKEILLDIGRHIKLMQQERMVNYEQREFESQLQSADRRTFVSYDTDLQSGGGRPTAIRQIRKDELKLSQKSSSPSINELEDAGQSDGENAPNRPGSERENTTADGPVTPTTTATSDRRYSRTDTALEPDQINRGGTGTERDRLETQITATSNTLSLEPQISGSFLLPEKSEDIILSEQEMLEYLLRSGMGSMQGKQVIYSYVVEHSITKAHDLIPMLKNRYGTGGARGDFGNGLTGYTHSGKGIELLWSDSEGAHEVLINWRTIATTLLQLIQNGSYDGSLSVFPPQEEEWTLFDYVQQAEDNKSQAGTLGAPIQREPIGIESAENQEFQEETKSTLSVTQEPLDHPTFTPQNFHYNTEVSLYPSGAKSKYKRNIEAIRLLKLLESERRVPSPDEQRILAGYVGWGGLANAFNENAKDWEYEAAELKHLLDDREYAEALNSTITAYYTEPELIRYIYQALERFGLNDGEHRKILDPAMGTGNFFSVLPDTLQQAKLFGVELDGITGRMAKQLYPSAQIHVQGFETTNFTPSSFDAVIGNIPFNNIQVFDHRFKESYLIHDYFFIKSMELVKPGGIIAFITSKGTFDKQDSSIRKELAEQADLIGAIRLPNTAFKAVAGTEVTTDMVFLQKLDQPRQLDTEQFPDWISVSRTSDGIPINTYFVHHPEMVLGDMNWDRSMYGSERTTACFPKPAQNLYAELSVALHFLKAQFSALPDDIQIEDLEDGQEQAQPADAGTKNFTYVIKDNQIYFCENEYLLFQDIKGKKAERIKGLCDIRDALKTVIDIQSREYGYDISELQQGQQRLNEVYDQFVNRYGPINDRANTAAFSDDDQLPLLRSIEDMTPEKNWVKAQVFTKPTIRPNRMPVHADSALQALQICLNQKLKVDLSYMSRLYGKSTEEILDELGDRLFLNPQKYVGNQDEGWELDEEYLSGNVKDKLAYAKLKTSEYPELFERNVIALSAVQPAPLLPGDIDFRIGSPWIPIKYYRDFMYETFGTAGYHQSAGNINVEYMEYANSWRVSGKSLERESIKVNRTFGTSRVNAYDIYEGSLNLQSITVRDLVTYFDQNGNEQIKYVVNAKETMIARAKQQQIKEAFSSWLFKDKDRADILLGIYNEKFNTLRPRTYDGSHLVFQGMSEEVELRQHQQDVAARIIYSGTALMAHEVGAGKTAAMIASGMYLKQLGAIQKPIYCVPNHLTEQWANEFMRFFPAANILVTTKKDFSIQNRNRFVSKIAMGDYDAIIIGHSQFEKIPISHERQEQLLQNEINGVTQMIDQVKREKGDNWTIKQMVIFQNQLKHRLERLVNEDKKDNLLYFEQLGVDMLFVDEAHAYKNCFTFTKMRNVAGIGKTSSQRAMDMLLKCQYIQEINQGRGVVFATGTPISNSMSEMYVMQRYLQPMVLKRLGLDFFDNWAATFGEVVSSLEMTPEGSGYRMKSRFAKFHNLPELMNIFRTVADIQTAEMLKLPVPELKHGKPEIVVTECSPFQKLMMDSFVERAEKIRNNDVLATEDNMLKLTNEAKLMSIDPRLVDPEAPVESDSKLTRCISNVFDIWEQSRSDRLTQVIFSDSGTPKPGYFNVYDETKTQLINKGIPEQEIAFIHDAKTDIQREELFEQVRRGEVSILLGSTQKMGTGTNVQDRLIAAHHLDCPWRPADITQRDGRILRQGNKNNMVQIFRYVTKGTFDSYLWQIQEQKLRYISQVMTGKSISRSCEDADETVLSAAEVKAIATANPLLAEKMQVDNEVIRLKLLKANWNNERLIMERQISQQYPREIQACEQRIERLKVDLALVDQTRDDEFLIVLEGEIYNEKPQAGELLLLLSKVNEFNNGDSIHVGRYRGFELYLSRSAFNIISIKLNGAETYFVDLGDSPIGNITRLENVIEKIPVNLHSAEQRLCEIQTQFAEATIEVGKPFEFDQKLQEMLTRQVELNSQLEFQELKDQTLMININNEISEIEQSDKWEYES
ncbi:N-6 DNA methylase [Paenibacillus odorifer]|uniref:N-6 DNA methylase n=2 Tax=Paenibacillus TaxID=44249 RepID=UPI00096F0C9C|nr:helicase [Paenibacillus odorifer]